MAETENKNPGSLSDRVRSLRLTETNEANGNAWWWLPWAFCFVLLCLDGFLALEAFSPIDDATLKKLAEERGLDVGKPTSSASDASGKTEIVLESKGYIVPISLIQVSPKISGTVVDLRIKEGMAVEKDTVLAVIEEFEYEYDLDGAVGTKQAAQGRWDRLTKYRKKEEEQAKAELDEAKFQLVEKEAKYKRAVDLDKKNAAPVEDLEAAESAFRSMKAKVERLEIAYDLMLKGPRDADIDAMRAEFVKADSDWKKAKWRYGNTQVKAPIKGIILSKKTEEGNIVNPSAFSNGLSASLCEMADLHKLEVDLVDRRARHRQTVRGPGVPHSRGSFSRAHLSGLRVAHHADGRSRQISRAGAREDQLSRRRCKGTAVSPGRPGAIPAARDGGHRDVFEEKIAISYQPNRNSG